jgi:hypothetical protein
VGFFFLGAIRTPMYGAISCLPVVVQPVLPEDFQRFGKCQVVDPNPNVLMRPKSSHSPRKWPSVRKWNRHWTVWPFSVGF